MQYSQPVTNLIKTRSSWRTYTGEPLKEEHRKQLQDFLSANTEGPFGNNIRFELVDLFDNKNRNDKLGTYGIIKRAQTFIVGVVKKSQMDLEDYGHIFEKTVLFATDLGLGTCWLGGTFTRDTFENKVGLSSDEIIPAITPVGYITGNRSVLDATMRFMAGSKKRKKWEEIFFYNDLDTPLKERKAEKYAIPLEMVRMAPSASNKQPWLIVFNDRERVFHFYLNHTRGYSKLLKYDIQHVDIGIAMCHFELTARELNIQGQWVIKEPTMKCPQEVEYICSWRE